MELRISLLGKKKISAHFDGYEVSTDQPKKSGGDGSAPSPFDLFLASIGTCAGFFAQSYCQAHNLPTDGIELVQTQVRDEKTRLVTSIKLELTIPASFPEQHRDGVINAINACSVKKHFAHPPNIYVETKQRD